MRSIGSRIAEWQPWRWPLKQALAQFASDSIDLVVLLRIALFFIVEIYREPIDAETRDSIFTAIMDSLARKPGADIGLKSLQGKLGELFGLNAVGAQQAEECLRRWLSSRDLAA